MGFLEPQRPITPRLHLEESYHHRPLLCSELQDPVSMEPLEEARRCCKLGKVFDQITLVNPCCLDLLRKLVKVHDLFTCIKNSLVVNTTPVWLVAKLNEQKKRSLRLADLARS